MFPKFKIFGLILLFSFLVMMGCVNKTESLKKFQIDYEKYTLDNGLEIVLHPDKSDPVVAVAVQYHVGSNREVEGKTGFAHLFEHMMFQESKHVGQDQFFKKIQAAGGTLNGGTSKDGTIYFQVVPKNALEMVLWMESDRMGFLRSTITQEAFTNQRNVVMNEKRQNVDNRPYGQTRYILGKLLYPEGHPYSWQVIGSMRDVATASLEDVHQFHKKWYRPNNATLVVAGDFDGEQTKKWIEKYFGELESPHKIKDLKPQPAELSQNKVVYYEDNFAKSPELTMVFPTVEQYHPDSYALSFLGQLYARGKKSPLYKVVVKEKKLAPSVSGYQLSQEIAGEFRIRVRSFPDKDLGKVKKAVSKAFHKFEEEGFTVQDLKRLKNKTETSFYNSLSSVLMKSFQLARYNEYADSPGYITKDLERILAVTKEDIWRVYEKYIQNKPYVMTNFVPKGKIQLAVEEANPFVIPKDQLHAEVKEPVKTLEDIEVDEIESSFDRSKEPPEGPNPEITVPSVWKEELSNGLEIYGIQHTELPLVQCSLSLKGGQFLDENKKAGTAHLLSKLMMQGTQNKTPIELEEAIDDLGASIRISSDRQSITIWANCLSSKFPDVFQLVEEILLEPRWDEEEFVRLKNEILETIKRNKANPRVVARNTFNKLLYGGDHSFGKPVRGTLDSVSSLTLADLKSYYKENFSPSVSHLAVAGAVSQEKAVSTFQSLEEKWSPKEVFFPEFETPAAPEKAQIYFVDVPGARQSVIQVGHLAVSYGHPDYYPATVMNYKLGGSFNSILNIILREEKGYTYGARSGFNGDLYSGYFSASSAVQSNATLESVQIFKNEISQYREGISAQDLQFTKDAIIKSTTRRFETLRSLLGMLDRIATYNLSKDYVKRREEIVRRMTIKRHQELAQKYIRPEKMIYVVVGDASTQMESLKQLGLGEPILIESR